jgi:hypothetical protein
MLVTAHLWRELGLEKSIDALSARDRADVGSLGDRALVLVANRLAAVSMRWRSGWRATLSATAAAGDSSRLGAKTLNARQVECLGSALRCVNSSNGNVRSIDCWRVRRRSSSGCLCSCAICSPYRSIWCFMTSLRPTLKAAAHPRRGPMAIAVMTSRAMRKCWSG